MTEPSWPRVVNTPAHVWHHRFVERAAAVASWSKDPVRKVGAVVVDDRHRSVSEGYNGFPRGMKDLEADLQDKATKRRLTVHAELNAILNSARSLLGCTMYCTSHPCHECAKAIVQAGIHVVVSPEPNLDHPAWGDSYATAVEILRRCGVEWRRA